MNHIAEPFKWYFSTGCDRRCVCRNVRARTFCVRAYGLYLEHLYLFVRVLFVALVFCFIFARLNCRHSLTANMKYIYFLRHSFVVECRLTIFRIPLGRIRRFCIHIYWSVSIEPERRRVLKRAWAEIFNIEDSSTESTYTHFVFASRQKWKRRRKEKKNNTKCYWWRR